MAARTARSPLVVRSLARAADEPRSFGTIVTTLSDGREQVTLMGEPSSGHFADQPGGVLPNGWSVLLSGERYIADDGIIYEVAGVPAEVAVEFDVAAVADGTDVTLEAAIAALE